MSVVRPSAGTVGIGDAHGAHGELRRRRGRHPPAVEQSTGSAQRAATSALSVSAVGHDWDAFVSYAHGDSGLVHPVVEHLEAAAWSIWLDRKSTRLNSSHLGISY